MPSVVVLPKARVDINAISDFIAEDSEAQAERFVRRLDEKFKLLAQQPQLGRLRDELMVGLRGFPFERYIIFYRSSTNGIDIVRVLHSARDLELQFPHKN